MRLNVAYASGEIYSKHAAVSIISLFENNKMFKEIYVYIIDDGISDNTKKVFYDIFSKYHRNLVFIKSTDFYDKSKFNNIGVYPKIIFAKLFLYNISNIDKIIYIDCDMIIKGSLYELWNTNIDNYLIAGVRMPTPIEYKKWFSTGNNNKYINSGFIFFNLQNWRLNNMASKINKFIDDYKGYKYIDENVICSICKEKILILDPKYNLCGLMIAFTSNQIKKLTNEQDYYSQKQLDEAKLNPVVIHFSNEMYERPWYKKSNHPFKSDYIYYLSLSTWKNELENNTNKSMKIKIRNVIINILPFDIYYLIRQLLKK